MSLKKKIVKKQTLKMGKGISTVVFDTEMTVSGIIQIMKNKKAESIELDFATVYSTEFVPEEQEDEADFVDFEKVSEEENQTENKKEEQEEEEEEEEEEEQLPF